MKVLPPLRAARSSPVPLSSGVCPVAPTPVLVGAVGARHGRPRVPSGGVRPLTPLLPPAWQRPGSAGPCEGATPGGS